MFDKKEKQLIRLVHVIALGALHIGSDSEAYKMKTKKELEKYAFPLEIDL